MKNKNLERKLNIYADSLKCKEDILEHANHEMDLRRNSGVYGKNKSFLKKRFRFALAGVAAASVVLMIVLGIVLTDLMQSYAPLKPYSLDSLQKESVTQEEFSDLAGALFLTGETGQTDGRYFIYVNEKNQVYTAKAIFRVIRDGCVDEITIISDLKNNLSDYKPNKPSKGNTVIREYDIRENGEYYSYLAKLADNVTYYVIITSPSQYAGQYYEDILF